jgi:4a-hydroxytetrahydrobiopterin dehydratase
MNSLTNHHCVPCEGGVKPLARNEFSVYLPQVPEWTIVGDKQIERDFLLKNFTEAIAFINAIAEIANTEGHHPDILLHDFKNVKITLSTHAIGGLSINDFVMAVKISEIEKTP